MPIVCGVLKKPRPNSPKQVDPVHKGHHGVRFAVRATCKVLLDKGFRHHRLQVADTQVAIKVGIKVGIKVAHPEEVLRWDHHRAHHRIPLRMGIRGWANLRRFTTTPICLIMLGHPMPSIQTRQQFPIRSSTVRVLGRTSDHSIRTLRSHSAGVMPRCDGMMVSGI